MPYYTHKCSECDSTQEHYLKIADRDSRVGDPCQHANTGCAGTVERIPELPGFTSSESLGRIKAPAEFRDVLKAIKKENPGSTINER